MPKVCVLWIVGIALFAGACTSESTMPTPQPRRIAPKLSHNKKDVLLTIEGDGFIPVPIRRLADGREFMNLSDYRAVLYNQADISETVNLFDVERIDDNTLQAILRQDTPTGKYGIRIISPTGDIGERDELLEVVNSTNREPDSESPPGDTDPDQRDFDYYCPPDEECADACNDDACHLGCASQIGCAYQCHAQTCNTTCEGSGDCSVSCGASSCHLDCSGSGDCTIDCNSSACTAVNTGSSVLSVTCFSDVCSMDCSDSSQCMMVCDSENCDVTCDGEYQECPDNYYVCNMPCPNS